MSRVSADRPLSDTQERVLIWLVDLAREDDEQRQGRGFHQISRAPLVRGTDLTAQALRRRGLVEIRYRPPFFFTEVRVTDAGIALCDGMGD